MFSSLAGKTSLFRVTLVGIGGVGGCLLWKSQTKNSSVNVVLAKSPAHPSHVHSQTRRKAKFEQFASIELDGQYFMTPIDFLESLTHRDLPGNDWHMDTHPATYRSNANLTVPKTSSFCCRWMFCESKTLCFLADRVKLLRDKPGCHRACVLGCMYRLSKTLQGCNMNSLPKYWQVIKLSCLFTIMM